MARTKGSGYKSQLYILLVLNYFGSLCGEEIMEKTGLHREDLWKNFKVLSEVGIIKKEKVGRKTNYSIAISEEALELILYVLYMGGPRNSGSKERRIIKKKIKAGKRLYSLAKKAEDFEPELVDLSSTGEIPYPKLLRFAVERRRIVKQLAKIDMKSKLNLTDFKRKEIRALVKHPKDFKTKEIILPSSKLKVTIREPTVFELIDAFGKKEIKNDTEPNSDFIEAVTCLLLLENYGKK